MRKYNKPEKQTHHRSSGKTHSQDIRKGASHSGPTPIEQQNGYNAHINEPGWGGEHLRFDWEGGKGQPMPFPGQMGRTHSRINEPGWGNDHLRALPGGDKKKGIIPTNDHEAELFEVIRLRPQALPEKIADEATREVEGINDLERNVDIIIVNSPCYSSEIYALIDQMKKGMIDFDAGRSAIRERLAYLLTNEFKNVEGEINRWAETNKGDQTVENANNMGADWYRMGTGRVLYMALTDWNDPSDPSMGANNYTVFKYTPPTEEQAESWQEYGSPLTSRDASGQSGIKTRARRVGNPIDITWIQRIINMLTQRDPIRSRSKKSWEQKGPGKTIAESGQSEAEYDDKEKAIKTEAKLSLKQEKMRNTIVYVQIFEKGKDNSSIGGINVNTLLAQQIPRCTPGTTFHFNSISAQDPQKGIFTEQEIRELIRQTQIELLKNDPANETQ